jgi:hypothetical protein
MELGMALDKAPGRQPDMEPGTQPDTVLGMVLDIPDRPEQRSW